MTALGMGRDSSRPRSPVGDVGGPPDHPHPPTRVGGPTAGARDLFPELGVPGAGEVLVAELARSCRGADGSAAPLSAGVGRLMSGRRSTVATQVVPNGELPKPKPAMQGGGPLIFRLSPAHGYFRFSGNSPWLISVERWRPKSGAFHSLTRGRAYREGVLEALVADAMHAACRADRFARDPVRVPRRRKTATGAISSGSPIRPSGVPAISLTPSSPPRWPSVAGVSVRPGRIELTRILRGPNSRASAHVIVSTAPLVAA